MHISLNDKTRVKILYFCISLFNIMFLLNYAIPKYSKKPCSRRLKVLYIEIKQD